MSAKLAAFDCELKQLVSVPTALNEYCNALSQFTFELEVKEFRKVSHVGIVDDVIDPTSSSSTCVCLFSGSYYLPCHHFFAYCLKHAEHGE